MNNLNMGLHINHDIQDLDTYRQKRAILEKRFKLLHAHKHRISKENDNSVVVYFDDTNKEYEDYIVRSLKEIYGYDCNNSIDKGIHINL